MIYGAFIFGYGRPNTINFLAKLSEKFIPSDNLPPITLIKIDLFLFDNLC